MITNAYSVETGIGNRISFRIFIVFLFALIPAPLRADLVVHRLTPNESVAPSFLNKEDVPSPDNLQQNLVLDHGQASSINPMTLLVSASFPSVQVETTEVMVKGKMTPRSRINIDGGALDEEPAGAPELPYLEYFILLPKGYSVDDAHLDFYQVQKTELPQDLNFIPSIISFTDLGDPEKKSRWEASLQEDEAIYSKPGFYPDKAYRLDEQIRLGYRLVRLRIWPFQYQPLKRELLSFTSAKGYIRLIQDAPDKRIPDIYIRRKDKDQAFIKRIVVNDEEISTYFFDEKDKGRIR